MAYFRFDSKYFAVSARMFEKDEGVEEGDDPGAVGASVGVAPDSCECSDTCACSRGALDADLRIGFRRQPAVTCA